MSRAGLEPERDEPSLAEKEVVVIDIGSDSSISGLLLIVSDLDQDPNLAESFRDTTPLTLEASVQVQIKSDPDQAPQPYNERKFQGQLVLGNLWFCFLT